MEWRLWTATAVLAVALGTVSAAAAENPAPIVKTPVDLSVVLAHPPGPDFVARPEGMYGGMHVGALDLDAIVAENSGSASVRSELRRQRFTRGYRKVWDQPGTSTTLTEKVEEFELDAGARDHLIRARSAAVQDRDFRGFFDIGAFTEDSATVVEVYGDKLAGTNGLEVDDVLFVKGNLLFVIAMSRPNQTSVEAVLAQARDQYREAPGETIDQAGQPDRLPPPPLVPAGSQLRPQGLAIVLGVLGVVLLLTIPALLLVLLAVRQGRTRTFPILSADRRFWWDGSTWRDTTVSVPVGAPRSPDGRYWFDGVAWRPVAPAGQARATNSST